MAYKVLQTTALFKEPDTNSTILIALTEDEIVGDAGEQKDDFVKVKHPASIQAGWVLVKDVQKVAEPPRPPVSKEDFVSSCVLAERAVNVLPATAPWYAVADFVIARAIIETNIANVGPQIPGSDGVGPLQVTTKEWEAFLKSPLGVNGGFQSDGRDEPTVQTTGAAFRMFADVKTISDAKAAKGVGSAGDPFVPSYLDVFHAYLTDSPGAAVAILDASASDTDKTKKLNEVLKGLLTDDQIAALFKARGKFTGLAEQPKTVAEFVAGTEAALNDALKQAFDLQKQFVPGELPQIKQGEAPWFDVAQEEEKRNIAEPNPRILTYFQATDLRPLPTSTDTPWCGAFAAFCVKGAGDVVAASIPKGAARAANWKAWGDELPRLGAEIPQGAVVVLSPGEGTGGSGHVGFFVGFTDDGKHVTLLGGNQHNQVKHSNFPVRQIAAIRWLDLAPVTAAEDGGGPPSNAPISDAAIALIVKYEVGGEADYRAQYHRPEWPQGASGVTIGIGYDVGYSTAMQLQADWGDKLPPRMIDSLKRVAGVTGRAAQALARQMRDEGVDVPFAAAMDVFTKRDIPKWVGIVQRALPNTDKLSRDCLGVLVSLAYNRGASFSKQGDRYAEMRAIKACMAASEFAGIPEQIRAMKRLWPHMRGLRERRDAEADLFESGRHKPAGT